MMKAVERKNWRQLTAWALAVYLVLPLPSPAATKVKLRGYITARVDDRTVAILDDKLELTVASIIKGQDATGEHAMTMAELGPGMLLEADGQWLDRHKFFAEKVAVDLRDAEKQIHGAAYLQEEPAEASKISGGESAALKADGYWLDLTAQTHREWDAAKVTTAGSAGSSATSNGAATGASKDQALAGMQVKYSGVRGSDGRIGAERIEL